MGGKSWTQAEDAKLKEIFESGENIAQCVSLFPGRTYQAIKVHADRVGIEHADYRSWTPGEDQILREIWTTPRNIKEGMHRLERRSYEAAKIRAARLGLGKKTPAEPGTRSWVLRAVMAFLKGGAHKSMNEIADEMGIDRKSIQSTIKAFHGKEFYIASWVQTDANHRVMKWALGAGHDAPKPAPKSPAQCNREYRQRNRVSLVKVNPFAAALGLVEAPKGNPGRVYIHLTDSKEDEYAEAA
jgi:hypothetical protein